MVRKSARSILSLLVVAGLLSCSTFLAGDRAQASMLPVIIGTIFTQPVDPGGTLLQTSRLEPDGSNQDRYIWDNFTLPSNGTITEIDWTGGYDPLRFGGGGPVLDFIIAIYPSIPAGTEPAVAYPPLVEYRTGGNAGQTPLGMVGAIPMYSYKFILPVSFDVTAGVKYWVHIQALQQGSIPDWGIAGGMDGNSSHYVRESGAGGDIRFHAAPGDAAFTLLGPITDVPGDIFLSNTKVNENQPANTVVGVLGATDPNPDATFTFSLSCAIPGVDDNSFNIIDANLQTSAPFHYEIKNTYNICVRVTNQVGMSLDKDFVITVNDLTYLPCIINGSVK